ncbi:MAG: mechanosensitive ion channel, partial [Chloroflexi bacterium]|nr:mechanosensitive ion channel [Chloroflexota bacterium]
NLAGGVTLAIGGAYHVGDRIEVDSITGDVVDIGLLYTTLLELRNWVGGDQPTGRLVVVPNGVVLSCNVANFTKDNRFVWDEITIPVTYESDWQMVSDWFRATLEEETQEDSKLASKDLSVLQKKYYLTGRVITPTVFVSFNDN